jgi:hypothetical protein
MFSSITIGFGGARPALSEFDTIQDTGLEHHGPRKRPGRTGQRASSGVVRPNVDAALKHRQTRSHHWVGVTAGIRAKSGRPVERIYCWRARRAARGVPGRAGTVTKAKLLILGCRGCAPSIGHGIIASPGGSALAGTRQCLVPHRGRVPLKGQPSLFNCALVDCLRIRGRDAFVFEVIVA